MQLTILNSNSKGNCYLFKDNSGQILIVECGVHIDKIKKAIDYDVSSVCGALASHEHGDHACAIKDITAAGIDVYASTGTIRALKFSSHRLKHLQIGKAHTIGNFAVIPFDVRHDAAEPVGFLLSHPEAGTVLFLTDTYFCPYTFPGLNNIIIEANYSQKIIDEKLNRGAGPGFLRDRVLQSHMSIDVCESTLLANDLSQVNNIVLIHLSDSNSNEIEFKSQIEMATGKKVFVAGPNMTIPLNKTAF